MKIKSRSCFHSSANRGGLLSGQQRHPTRRSSACYAVTLYNHFQVRVCVCWRSKPQLITALTVNACKYSQKTLDTAFDGVVPFMCLQNSSFIEVGTESLVIMLVLFPETIWRWIFNINKALFLYVRKEGKSFQKSQPRKCKASPSFLSSLILKKELETLPQILYEMQLKGVCDWFKNISECFLSELRLSQKLLLCFCLQS